MTPQASNPLGLEWGLSDDLGWTFRSLTKLLFYIERYDQFATLTVWIEKFPHNQRRGNLSATSPPLAVLLLSSTALTPAGLYEDESRTTSHLPQSAVWDVQVIQMLTKNRF